MNLDYVSKDWKLRLHYEPTNFSDALIVRLNQGSELIMPSSVSNLIGSKNAYKLYLALSCVIENLRRYRLTKLAKLHPEAQGIYWLKNDAYYKGERFGLTILKKAIDILVQNRIIDSSGKYWVQYGQDRKGYASLIEPSASFNVFYHNQVMASEQISYSTGYSVESAVKPTRLELRADKLEGRIVVKESNPNLGIGAVYLLDLKKINQHSIRYQWSIKSPFPQNKVLLPEIGLYNYSSGLIDLSKLTYTYKRIFNYNYECGGRFYADFQNEIYSIYRQYLYVNGKPTVELDYVSIHLFIAYALEGIDYQEDPYELSEDLVVDGLRSKQRRSLAKIIMLTLLNSSKGNSVFFAVLNRWRKKVLPRMRREQEHRRKLGLKVLEDHYFIPSKVQIDNIQQALLLKHHKITKYFSSNAGIKFQFIESQVASKVLLKFRDLNKPILCIHDSFVVSEEDEDLLSQVMLEAYKNILGRQFNIRTKKQSKLKDELIILNNSSKEAG